MRIAYMSDLHAEHWPDHGKSFVAGLDASGVDVLIAAGDIGVAHGGSLQTMLSELAEKFPAVVFVAGNHEYYGSHVKDMAPQWNKLPSNVHRLEKTLVTLGGQRFVGCTLWFQDDYVNPARHCMNDFRAISGFTPWVHKRHAESLNFLRREVQESDVVVTHHVPSRQGILPQDRGLPITQFFASGDVPEDVLMRPAHWVYGHSHRPHEFEAGNCKFHSNPYGYYNAYHTKGLNPVFNPLAYFETSGEGGAPLSAGDC